MLMIWMLAFAMNIASGEHALPKPSTPCRVAFDPPSMTSPDDAQLTCRQT
jgi:hypothetical protein